ncbi:MAG: hypothetical protein H0X03_00185 [Nitrosopumilus sp.]|nr:hypothetical protein [Nitrosopumilus sp.]
MSSENVDVNQNIVGMGYILPKIRVQYPSFYKLTDGTILRVIVLLNYILPFPNKLDDYDINSTNIVSSFVPLEKRRPELFTPANALLNTDIIDEDVEYEVLKENFSVYDLTNGMVMSIKPVVGQVKKTKFYSIQGEPIYITSINPIVKFKKS